VELAVRRYRGYEDDGEEGHDDDELEENEEPLLDVEAVADDAEEGLRYETHNGQNCVDDADDGGRVAELLCERLKLGCWSGHVCGAVCGWFGLVMCERCSFELDRWLVHVGQQVVHLDQTLVHVGQW
jgi:hypothetical protein